MFDPHSLPPNEKIVQLIDAALSEDMGSGDHTSLATIDAKLKGTGRVRVKEQGVISGIEIGKLVAQRVDPEFQIETFSIDGDKLSPGDIVMNITGNVRNLLRAERIVLNFMQRMSGIATLTRRFVEAVAGTKAVILDTRKTTPNFRYFEKKAVVDGGGQNHRYGLYDMIMVKDNHVDESGGITNALRKVSEYQSSAGLSLKVEIETRNIDEVKQALATGLAHRIMLDNFTPALLSDAVKLIDGKMETEASGGITLENVAAYAKTGVDYISVGALTHSYRSLDISMKISDK